MEEVSSCLSSRLIDKDLLVEFFWTWFHNLSETLSRPNDLAQLVVIAQGRQNLVHLGLFVNGNSFRTCCVCAEKIV